MKEDFANKWVLLNWNNWNYKIISIGDEYLISKLCAKKYKEAAI